MKHFANCRTLDDLKKEYRRLCMMYHPDTGHGDEAIMKAINAEHDIIFEELKRQHNATADAEQAQRDAGQRTETYTRRTTETAEEFRTIIIALLRLDGLKIELCGSWLWIAGETKKHKDVLKALGCRWSSGKTSWYWHHPEDGYKPHRSHATMSDIRMKYGSQEFSRASEMAGLPVGA